MFYSGSPYSPFFTSGLIPSAPPTPAGPRRGSLPTDSLAPSTPSAASLYCNLQSTRDHKEYRSFLSLDLAESQSLRSASLKRKAPLSHFASVDRLAPPVPLSPFPRPSRDSFRSIPSPKPAPSITLPELPKPKAAAPRTVPPAPTSAPPRLPSIPNVASFDILSISRTQAPVEVTALPKRRLPTRSSTTSSVSTRARKINRSNALDRLEGKAAPKPTTVPASVSKFSTQKNFMSLSDDESDDSDVDSLDAKSYYSDDFLDTSDNELFYTGYFEPEDLVLPSLTSSDSPIRPKSPPLRRSSTSPTKSSFGLRKQAVRRSTKEWFPLKSFIDLRSNDDSSTLNGSASISVSISPSSPSSSWSWRSFIDVAHLP